MKKTSSTETTVFVYDGGGLLVAEYSTALAPIQQVSYLTTDHLGTPRIITNENGVVTSRKDSMTFGGEAISSQRVSGPTGNGYNPSNVRQDYTGYEKDSESGLEFAQARQYNSMHGRFTSVDPLNESGVTGNPQTFNRYAYVSNDPLNSVDPSGMAMCSAEYSYEQCGGDSGFWGDGEFGDHVAYNRQTLGDVSPQVQGLVNTYLQRVSNSQAGMGFRTHAEVEEAAAVAMFKIFYEIYDDDTYRAWFNSDAVTVYQFLPPGSRIANVIRDVTAPIHELTMPGTTKLTNWLSQRLWGTNLIDTDSAEYNDADTVVTLSTLPLPGPGGKLKAGNLILKGFTKHGINQAITRGVRGPAILDAVRNPLKTTNVVYDILGRPSYRIIGSKATIAVNPVTGKVISVNPTSSKLVRRLNR